MMRYRITDAATSRTLLEVPIRSGCSRGSALTTATRQARRHAASGKPVHLTGPDLEVIYWLDPETDRVVPYNASGEPHSRRPKQHAES